MKAAWNIFIGLLISFLFLNSFEACRKYKEYESIISDLTDSVKKTILENGNLQAKNNVLVTDINTLKAVSKNQQGIIKDLADRLTKKTEAAVAFQTTTSGNEVVATQIIDTTDDCNPIYKAEYNDGWNRIYAISTKDSTTFDFSFKDKYLVNFEKENKVLMCKIESANPKTDIIGQKAFMVPKEKRNTGKLVTGAFLVGFGTCALLIKVLD